ncbi:MAG: iron-sulfur cluster assembly scaffold protein [Proteobacteria bacterium]|nr:iron-sulfur cluster assembly scaffold protein [Pseudomonadota bacterium]
MADKHKPFDFFQDHAVNYLEMALDSRRQEVVAHPDGYGKMIRDCGDTLEMFVFLAGDIVQSVSFSLKGCIHTNACANTVAHLAENKSVDQCLLITRDDIISFLETLPENEHHCADLALNTFRKALSDFRNNKGNKTV